MVRLVKVALILFALFSVAILYSIKESRYAITAIGFMGASFLLFGYAIYPGAKQIEKKLITLNCYLKNLHNLDEVAYTERFLTQEFELLNRNLIKALKKAKKREDIKKHYNAKLKLKNRQRADMLSAIAHEFRNPIASIMGYSQTLYDDPYISPALQEKFLLKIYRNSHKIEDLLSRLMLWNRFESGKTVLHKSKFDLYSLAQEVIFSLQETYKNRTIHLQGSPLSVVADRTLIDIVLKNLIENALKYSKENVIVGIEKEGRVWVEDRGIGISDADIEKVTKKFYRSGMHEWDNSMGLGLSIVKSILKLHGRTLHIQSQLYKGSTFSFTLSTA